MARRTVTETQYTDDLDGSPAVDTVRFGVDGVEYEIDLSEENRTAFADAMALYIGHARKARKRT